MPGLVNPGDKPAGAVTESVVEVVNYTSEPLPITGGLATCSCVTWQDLPVMIPPRGAAHITIKTKVFRTGGRFQQHAYLYAVSGGHLHQLPFTIVARVAEPDSAAGN